MFVRGINLVIWAKNIMGLLTMLKIGWIWKILSTVAMRFRDAHRKKLPINENVSKCRYSIYTGFWYLHQHCILLLAKPSRSCTSLHRKHLKEESFKHLNCCTLSWISLKHFVPFPIISPSLRKVHLHEWTKTGFWSGFCDWTGSYFVHFMCAQPSGHYGKPFGMPYDPVRGSVLPL